MAAAVKLKEESSVKVATAAKLLNDSVSHELPASAEAAGQKEILDKIYADMWAKQVWAWNTSMQKVLANDPRVAAAGPHGHMKLSGGTHVRVDCHCFYPCLTPSSFIYIN